MSKSPDSLSASGIKKNAFVHKLYLMLSDPKLSHLIWWTENNELHNTFSLLPGKEFLTILTNYFKHGNVASFVRQLHMYGFHKVNDNNSDNSVWEFKHLSGKFKKDDEESLIFIKRRLSSNTSKSGVPASSPHMMSGPHGHGHPHQPPHAMSPYGMPFPPSAQFAPGQFSPSPYPPPQPQFQPQGAPGTPHELMYQPMYPYYYNDYMIPMQYVPYNVNYPPYAPQYHYHGQHPKGSVPQIPQGPPPGAHGPSAHGPHPPQQHYNSALGTPITPFTAGYAVFPPAGTPNPAEAPRKGPEEPPSNADAEAEEVEEANADTRSATDGGEASRSRETTEITRTTANTAGEVHRPIKEEKADEEEEEEDDEFSPPSAGLHIKKVLEPVPHRSSTTSPNNVYHRPSNASPHTILNTGSPVAGMNVQQYNPLQFRKIWDNHGSSSKKPRNPSLLYDPLAPAPHPHAHSPHSHSQSHTQSHPQSQLHPIQTHSVSQLSSIASTPTSASAPPSASSITTAPGITPTSLSGPSSLGGLVSGPLSLSGPGSTASSISGPSSLSGPSSGPPSFSNPTSLSGPSGHNGPTTISGMPVARATHGGSYSHGGNLSHGGSRSNLRDYPRSVPLQPTDKFRPLLVDMYKFHDLILTSNSNLIFSNASLILSVLSNRDNLIPSLTDTRVSITKRAMTPPPTKSPAHSPPPRPASAVGEGHSDLPVNKVSITSLLESKENFKRRKVSES